MGLRRLAAVEVGEVGEVSFHLGWTFHRANPNQSTDPRRVMTIIYMDADITVAEPVNDNQRGDLRAWLDETPVGEIPNGPLNPVLFRRKVATRLAVTQRTDEGMAEAAQFNHGDWMETGLDRSLDE